MLPSQVDAMSAGAPVAKTASPIDMLSSEIDEMAATAVNLSSIVERIHTSLYGDYQHGPVDAPSEDREVLGRIASLQQKIREIANSLGTTVEVANAIERQG